MKKLRVLISLATDASDFQREQAKSAQEAAKPLEVETKIIYAQDDAIAQSEQLLQAIQDAPQERPDAIVVQPVGKTGLPQVARAAARANIGWLALNSAVDYVAELRAMYHAPVFVFSSNQNEIGRIQGAQMEALLPEGGSILYIQGPSNSVAAPQRTAGMNETKPGNIQVRLLKTDGWTEEAGARAAAAWLRLATAQKDRITVIVGQSDLLALGARQKLLGQPSLSGLLCAGVDGLSDGGQKWVKKGLLAATVVVPPNAGKGLEVMVNAIRSGIQPPEVTLTVPTSYPSLEELRKVAS